MWQDNLKKFVELSGKTQEHIALEADINQGTLSNILTGRRAASIDTLESIVNVLGISMIDVFQNYEGSAGYKKLQRQSEDSIEEAQHLKNELTAIIKSASVKHLDDLRCLLPLTKKVLR